MDQALDDVHLAGLRDRAPVSVVIPCYRCSDTIRAAVHSVVNQTVRPAEIILIEDCSGDGGKTLATLKAIQNELQGLTQIAVLPQAKNRGAGESRNAGWKAASQKFIAFLDADDTWHPQKLEIQTAWMSDHPNFILSCHDSWLCAQGERAHLNTNIFSKREITWWKLLFTNDIATRTVMIRRDIHHRFPQGVRYAEDYQLWLRVLLGGGAAMRIRLPLACFYKEEFGAGGLSGNLASMHREIVRCIDELREERLISLGMYSLAMACEKIKYVRRIVVTAVRRIKIGCRYRLDDGR